MIAPRKSAGDLDCPACSSCNETLIAPALLNVSAWVTRLRERYAPLAHDRDFGAVTAERTDVLVDPLQCEALAAAASGLVRRM
jgi:hypothetical protein